MNDGERRLVGAALVTLALIGAVVVGVRVGNDGEGVRSESPLALAAAEANPWVGAAESLDDTKPLDAAGAVDAAEPAGPTGSPAPTPLVVLAGAEASSLTTTASSTTSAAPASVTPTSTAQTSTAPTSTAPTSTASASTAPTSTAPTTAKPSTVVATTAAPPAGPSTVRPSTAPPPTAPPSTAPPQTAPVGQAGDRGLEQRVIELTNARRQENGCPPLAGNDRLHAAALAHSVDMATRGYFSHTSLDGSSMQDRIERQGYAWRMIAENIAAGHPTPEAVVEGWMNSPGHRANILNCNLTEIGVGLHRLNWTQNFGTPR